ncbi:hypothetical protein BDN70DRAFT_882012 [Pholiota conissans]|uniref:Uncharacterized protein n=1 Tax=Pholiota conissans TaxID=109636 RepID=A0A9P5YY97_9AGAR|nr:hypothetical protein BDN70DRAFT_882012 [Pholiota conissans]
MGGLTNSLAKIRAFFTSWPSESDTKVTGPSYKRPEDIWWRFTRSLRKGVPHLGRFCFTEFSLESIFGESETETESEDDDGSDSNESSSELCVSAWYDDSEYRSADQDEQSHRILFISHDTSYIPHIILTAPEADDITHELHQSARDNGLIRPGEQCFHCLYVPICHETGRLPTRREYARMMVKSREKKAAMEQARPTYAKGSLAEALFG